MSPSPYQSKLLRLAIAQYRKGLDRHRQAFRHARSTTVATVEIGAALAMIPIFAVVQVSQMAGRRLKQSVKKKLFGVGGDGARLLNFSGFDEAALATSESTSSAKPPTAEHSMVQALRAVGNCLSIRQLRLLLKMEGKIRPLKADALKKLTGERKISASDQITGVASDLETRSLLLVINYSRVWNGLSADQQRQLQLQIGQFSPSVGMIQVANGGILTLCEKTTAISRKRNILTQPFRSFWVEVLRAVAWMKQRHRQRATTRLVSGRSQIEGAIAKLFAPKTISHEAVSIAEDLSKTRVKALITRSMDETVERERQPYCLDADVITVSYIEHPLERFLKWVDRILLWIEGQWQLFKRRLKL